MFLFLFFVHQVDIAESRTMPLFRPLRRVVRNFVNERQAFITIVFQRADTMPNMRWFRQVEPKTLPNAEIPDMINIDGQSVVLAFHSFGGIEFRFRLWKLTNLFINVRVELDACFTE